MGNHNEVFFKMKTNIIYKLLQDNNFKLSTDSRQITGCEIFFALQGDNFDGNKFARDALNRGALAAVIDNYEYKSGNCIPVKNVTEELQAVARRYRNNFKIPVLAVTGSNGKTTTKEILARVLSVNYKVHYTSGNLNNHIGVPLTLLACPLDADFMIVEMGANHKGEIAKLCHTAEPGYGLVTNIGHAHLEGFGSLDGIVEAKSELYDYIESIGGYVFYNESNELLRNILVDKKVKKISYKEPGNHSLSVVEVQNNPMLELLVDIDGEKYTYKTKLFGQHNLENIVAAVSVGMYFNIPPLEVKKAIESYIPDNNRSQVLETGNNTLICDSYNANPDSVSMSIESFRKYTGTNKILILGDMLELGEYETEEHKKILRELSSMDDLVEVILVGRVFNSLAPEYDMLSFETRDELMKYLTDKPVRNSMVLVKASRALGLEKIYSLF